MARQRDFAAEYARRIARGLAAGRSRTESRGKRVVSRLPVGMTRRARHAAAIRRQAETGEHGRWMSRTSPLGVNASYVARFYRGDQVARMAAEIRRLDGRVQVVGFGTLAAGYAMDWRGGANQWRTILTGYADDQPAGVGGRTIYRDWSPDSIEAEAATVFDEPGDDETPVRLYELRLFV